jgi:cobalt/nickel transport system permease protein
MSGVHLFASYAEGDSPIHRLPAGAKLAAALLFVIAVASVPVDGTRYLALPLGAVVAGAIVSRVPLSVFAARIALAQPFILGVAILALFQHRGLAAFASIAAKSTASVAATQLLAHTTRFHDLLGALRRARVPAALIVTLALLQRYLSVVIDESRRMRRARAARTWQTSRWTTWRALSAVIAASFVRSLARAERISVAMRARGWS